MGLLIPDSRRCFFGLPRVKIYPYPDFFIGLFRRGKSAYPELAFEKVEQFVESRREGAIYILYSE